MLGYSMIAPGGTFKARESCDKTKSYTIFGRYSHAENGVGQRLAAPRYEPIGRGARLVLLWRFVCSTQAGGAPQGWRLEYQCQGSICRLNSVHSRRLSPLVSWVTASPANIRFSTATICAERVTASRR